MTTFLIVLAFVFLYYGLHQLRAWIWHRHNERMRTRDFKPTPAPLDTFISTVNWDGWCDVHVTREADGTFTLRRMTEYNSILHGPDNERFGLSEAEFLIMSLI